MPLINADEFKDDLEDKPVKDGEYELRVAKAEYKMLATKNGEAPVANIMLTVEGADGEGKSPINHTIFYPKEDEKEENPTNYRRALRDVKRFLTVFGYPLDKGFDPEENTQDLNGLTGKCFVKSKEGDDGNMYARLRLPRVD